MGRMVFVKKHLVLIISTVLIAAILGIVGFAVIQAFKMPAPTEPTQESTQAATTATSAPTEPVEVYDIGIIQHSDVENCNNVYQGFIAELAANGYVNNNNINLDYKLEENNDKCKEAIQSFVDSDYDLIVAIGPFAAKLAASMTNDIPIVFAAVQEPEAVGLVKSNETPGGNVTGVSDYTPCFEQVCSVKQLFPDCKRIGAIYTATDTDSVTQAIMGRKEAKREEVNIPYSEYPVESKEDIKDALDSMLEDGVEVIYTPIDSFVNKNLDTIVEFSYENYIPIICGNKAMLDKGCFSTSITSYPAIGRKTGELVLDILVDGANPSTTPVAYTYDCYLHINADAMTKLNITNISDELKATAIIE